MGLILVGMTTMDLTRFDQELVDLPDWVADLALARPTLSDALASAVRLLHDQTIITAPVVDHYTLAMVFVGDDTYYMWLFDHVNEAWPQATVDDGEYRLRVLEQLRRRTLVSGIRKLFAEPKSITETLRTGSFWVAHSQALFPHLVQAWWTERLADGLTPEAARMMLGLTLPSDTWQRLEFADEQAHPHVRI